MITINTWRDPYDAGFTTTKPKQVALIVFLVFVLIFLFAAMKINGNETSKLEEDIEQKKYIDNMQSKK